MGLGSRGDIIKQMHAALHGDPARYRVLEGTATARTRNAQGARSLRKALAAEVVLLEKSTLGCRQARQQSTSREETPLIAATG